MDTMTLELPAKSSSQKLSIAENVRLWGTSSSIALLDPNCQIFSLPETEGIIGYRTENNCAVVLSDPVCPLESREVLVKSFHQFCKERHWDVIYTIASPKFYEWATSHHICPASMQLVDELILDPQNDPTIGSKGHLLRKKRNHSAGEGVSIHEYTGNDEALEKSIEEVSNTWLKGRQGAQIYLADFNVFSNRKGKRWFYAKQKDRIIGVLILNQLEALKGWHLNMQMAVPESPNGTTEALVLKVLDVLREEGCQCLTLSYVLSEDIGEMQGFGKISKWLAQTTVKIVRFFFPLDKRRKYWEKFQLKKEPAYQLFVDPSVKVRDIVGVLRVMHVRF